MKKSPDAFRTISEVARWLETPAHVLRFWESRFPDLKPVQRTGGRRYYRPEDMMLLGGIKHLLHTEGHTIKSVQERIKADGPDAVMVFSPPLASGDVDADDTDADLVAGRDARDGVMSARAAARAARSRADADPETAPPIGFFFDDSDDAEPAEAQSGTFAPTADQTPAAVDPDDNDPPPDTPPAMARLGVLPPLPDDPADDAIAHGAPVPLPARLRALHSADVPLPHRDTLTGLLRRLDGWRRTHG